MENLEPKREERSPISSLKFQKKSDYKKFRNFIKKETKELKGITAPKDDKLKSTLKVGAGGLGLLALGGLFGGKGKGKGNKEGNDVFPFAIGRNNQDPKIKIKTIRPKRPAKYKTRGTNANPKVKITQSAIQRQTIKTHPETLLNKKGRVITKAYADVESTVKQKIASGEISESPRKKIIQKMDIKPLDETTGKKVNKILKNIKKTKSISPKAFDIDDPNYIKDMDLVNKELYKLQNPDKGISGNVYDEAAKRQAFKDMRIDEGFDRLLDEINKVDDPVPTKFNKLRDGVSNFSKPDLKGRIFDTLSKNIFPEKGAVAKFSRRFVKGNKKITSDTFKGLSYKGPKFSLIGKLTTNPVVKAGLFFLDAYAAYSSGKQVFNFKDNIGTALYDLGVSINNEVYKNDPSKLKLYVSESSNENFRIKQVIRNQKINQRKQKTSGGNNVIVVPENKQNNEVTTNIPIKKGGTEVSFVPFEPLNSVGTDILLHKLNQ